MIKNILIVTSAEVSCEKLFFIASRQYALHKFCNFAIIQTFMMLKHHNIRENNLKLFYANLKEDSTKLLKDLLYEQEKQDQTMKNIIRRQYINNNKNINLNIIISLIFICLN